jgi:hypothetical protein
VDTGCFADCSDEITEKICTKARENNLCRKTCDAMAEVDSQLYGLNICGGFMTNTDTYSQFCGDISCPAPVVCGDDICEGNEVNEGCFKDCTVELSTKICDAAANHQICSGKCPALAQLEPTLYALGICGQLLSNEQTYTSFCGKDVCPMEDCDLGQDSQTVIACLKQTVQALDARVDDLESSNEAYHQEATAAAKTCSDARNRIDSLSCPP